MHVREFVLTRENVFVATPKGVSLPIERISDAIDAIQELRSAGTDRECTVAKIPLSGGREIRFGIALWQGAAKADIRLYFAPGDSDDRAPTRKGLRLNLALLAELEKGLAALERGMR